MDKLKKLFSEKNYQGLNDDYISLNCFLQYLRKKRLEYLKIETELNNYLSVILKSNIKISFNPYCILAKFEYGILKNKTGTIYFQLKENKCGISVYDFDGQRVQNTLIEKKLTDDKMLVAFLQQFYELSIFSKYDVISGLKTNFGLFVDLNCADINNIKVMVSDLDYRTIYAQYHKNYPEDFKKIEPSLVSLSPEFKMSLNSKTDDDVLNFYFIYNIVTNERCLKYINEEAKAVFDEQLFGEYYLSLMINISFFPKEIKEELKQFELINKIKLKEAEANELEYFRKL